MRDPPLLGECSPPFARALAHTPCARRTTAYARHHHRARPGSYAPCPYAPPPSRELWLIRLVLNAPPLSARRRHCTRPGSYAPCSYAPPPSCALGLIRPVLICTAATNGALWLIRPVFNAPPFIARHRHCACFGSYAPCCDAAAFAPKQSRTSRTRFHITACAPRPLRPNIHVPTALARTPSPPRPNIHVPPALARMPWPLHQPAL